MYMEEGTALGSVRHRIQKGSNNPTLGGEIKRKEYLLEQRGGGGGSREAEGSVTRLKKEVWIARTLREGVWRKPG